MLSFIENLIVAEKKPANGVRYWQVGGTRCSRFDGIDLSPTHLPHQDFQLSKHTF